jgi:hypothetical protein
MPPTFLSRSKLSVKSSPYPNFIKPLFRANQLERIERDFFSKNIHTECRDYPPHKSKQFRVLILTVDLASLFHCREKPSRKASPKIKQRKKSLISKG